MIEMDLKIVLKIPGAKPGSLYANKNGYFT